MLSYSNFNLLQVSLFSLLLWAALFSGGLFLAFYQYLVHLILRLKHGDLYGGIFDSLDALFLVESPSNCYITTVLYIKSDKPMDIYQHVKALFKEKVFEHPDRYPKLTSTRKHFAGYNYWLRKSPELEEVLQILQVPRDKKFDETCLKKLTGELAGQKFKGNESIMWDVHVSAAPLQGYPKGNTYIYPVIARFHHAITDGTSLVAFYINIFGDESCENYCLELFKEFKKKQTKQNPPFLKKLLNTLNIAFEAIFVSYGKTTEGVWFKPRDDNALHPEELSGRKVIAWAREERIECFPIVKQLKNKSNTKFVHVLHTALLASMINYYKRNSYPIPSYVTGLTPILLDFPKKPLVNNTAGVNFVLPLSSKWENLVDALQEVQKAMESQLRYSDTMVSYFICTKFIGYLPSQIISVVLNYKIPTFLFTNVPGGSKVKMLDGCVLEEAIPVAPNFRGIGFSVTTFTYDNKFQISVHADRNVIESQEEAQRIADDMLYYIKVLNKEFNDLVTN